MARLANSHHQFVLLDSNLQYLEYENAKFKLVAKS